MTALLEVRQLSVPIPGVGDRNFAVHELSFELHAGEILCIVGESGSGKSMCANAIMGLLPKNLKPSAGQILFRGADLLSLSETDLRQIRGRSIGIIFQEPMSALNPMMRVGEQIAEALEVHGASDRKKISKRVLELMTKVGLPEPDSMQYSYPFRLSGGQRQRVMIAMALAWSPAVLIADEPTTALDVTTQAQILKLIRSLEQDAKATSAATDGAGTPMGVIFITHDFGVVADIADRVAVMENGLLVEIGSAKQILDDPQHPYTKRLIAAVPRRTTRVSEVTSEPVLLEVRHLYKTYQQFGGWFKHRRKIAALDGVSFSLSRGETLGIVGESGSGKSTVARCILKLTPLDDGQVLYGGQNLAALSAHRFRPLRRDIQMVFQDPYASLNPRQTIGRTLCDGPVANGVSRRDAEQRGRELLELVELDPSAFSRYPNEFSGGQRQRIGIARALALDPKILIADEAVSALDVSVQAQVLKLLYELKQRLQLSLIFITHDLRVAAQICDSVLVMHRGQVVERGLAHEVFDRPQHAYTRALLAAIPGQIWNPTSAPDHQGELA